MNRRTTSFLITLLLCLSVALHAASVSADSDPLFPRRACTQPTVGFPTCYVPQADGMWAREELADTGTNWVLVGTVTFEEVAVAVGEVNATAP